MLERIVLAAIITFCVYVFLGLNSKSPEAPSLEMSETTPGLIQRITSLSF